MQIVSRNILVSVGTDLDFPMPLIKIWSLDKDDKEKSKSEKTFKVAQVGEDVTVTCFACLDDLTQMAVGLSDGSVILVTSELLRENTPKQRMIMQKGGSAVTGLFYKQVDRAFFPLKIFFCF